MQGARFAAGWISPDLELELPGLRLWSSEALAAPALRLDGSSPAHVHERLRELSNRFRGARAIAVRREPVAGAYRSFFRQSGLDPDTRRPPLEAALLERMLHGGFLSSGLLADVLLISLLDTGVPVWALDGDSLEGELGIRPSRAGEPLGRAAGAPALPGGRLVVADAGAALAVLFEAPAAGHAPDARTRRLTLFAVQVAGVPSLYVEEALWSSRAALEEG